MKFIFQPVVDDNNHIVLYIFSSNNENPEFITDPNVELCGSLRYIGNPIDPKNIFLIPLNLKGRV